MKKILVATDGSDNSERALLEAKKYAEYSTADLTILSIIKPLGYTTLGYQAISIDETNQTLEEIGESLLKESLALFENFKGKVNAKLRRGSPADEILNEAEEGDYDLIIMGSRGLGAFSRTILGSVSNKVLNHTRRNVLIIK